MKIYFWNGSEFNHTAAPCCEILVPGYRVKLLTITKRGFKLFQVERIRNNDLPVRKSYYDTPNENIRLFYPRGGTPYLYDRKGLE